MVSEWRETTLGEFVRLQRGHDLTAEERKVGPYPVMGSAGQNGTHSDFIVRGPGVIVGRSGSSIGRVHFTTKDYWPHNTCLYVTDFLGNNPKYAFYLLGTLDLANYNSGSAQPSLNRNYIYSKPVVIPGYRAQEEIAGFLSGIDDRIDNLRQTNTTLESIAQALFKSWFVDFDPVRAKVEGRVPEGMDAASADLFPDTFEDTELGPVPKGWKVVSLADAFEINPRRELRKGTEAPYLDMASIPTVGCVPEKPVARNFSTGAKFTNGDTLVARITPCLENGKTAFVDFLKHGQVGWGSTEFIVLRPLSPVPAFVGYLLARRPDFRAHAIQAMSGTSGRQRVEVGRLQQFQVVVPDDDVARAFGELVAPMQKALFANAERVDTLASLRDTLLPRLISGRLRLPEAVHALGSA